MKTPTIEDLKRLTSVFFKRHWNQSVLGSNVPQWSEPWYFEGGIPNNGSRGCYAFFNQKDDLLYVGIGIGLNGTGRYTGHGLGSRLNRIWETIPGERGKYQATESYSHVHHIRTISFGEEGGPFWLAAALEIFLIYNLKPEKNVTYKTD